MSATIINYWIFIYLSLSLTPISCVRPGTRLNFEDPTTSNWSPPTYYNEDYLLSQLDPVDRMMARRTLHLAAEVGLPSYDNILLFNEFLLSYDQRLKGPAWVMEVLTHDDMRGMMTATGTFHPDPRISFRRELDEYSIPGYDIGRMAPPADFSHRHAIHQTNALSNVWPRDQTINHGVWLELEKYVRRIANLRRVRRVFVITGPVFNPLLTRRLRVNSGIINIIRHNDINIPSHFFKVMLTIDDRGRKWIEAFMIPNYPIVGTTFKSFRLQMGDLDDLEYETGLMLFNKVEELHRSINLLYD